MCYFSNLAEEVNKRSTVCSCLYTISKDFANLLLALTIHYKEISRLLNGIIDYDNCTLHSRIVSKFLFCLLSPVSSPDQFPNGPVKKISPTPSADLTPMENFCCVSEGHLSWKSACIKSCLLVQCISICLLIDAVFSVGWFV